MCQCSKHFTWVNLPKPRRNRGVQNQVIRMKTVLERLNGFPRVTEQGWQKSLDVNSDGLALRLSQLLLRERLRQVSVPPGTLWITKQKEPSRLLS